MSCASRSRRSTSRLENGSSSSSRCGCGASARASATRCCWPPESWCGARFAACARPTRSSTCVDALLALGARQVGDAEGHVVAHVEVREQGVVLEHHADAAGFGLARGFARRPARRPSMRHAARWPAAPARPRRAAARSCRSPRGRSARRSGPCAAPARRPGRRRARHGCRRSERRPGRGQEHAPYDSCSHEMRIIRIWQCSGIRVAMPELHAASLTLLCLLLAAAGARRARRLAGLRRRRPGPCWRTRRRRCWPGTR